MKQVSFDNTWLPDKYSYQTRGSCGGSICFWLMIGEDILDRFQVAWDNWCEKSGYVGSLEFGRVIIHDEFQEVSMTFKLIPAS